jgi:hypothetical protein
MNTKESIMGKIKALMAKTTDNGASEAEAANAMKMAQRLMAEHAIEAAEIVDTSDPVNLFGEFPVTEAKSLPSHIVAIIPVIEETYAVKVVVRQQMAQNLSTGRHHQAGVKVCLFGDVHSCCAAKWTFDFLIATYKDLWTSYRVSRKAGRKDLDPFFLGLSDGLLEKLRAEKKIIELQLPRARGAIVLVKGRLDSAFQAEYPQGRAITRQVDATDAYAEGLVRGRKINVARQLEEGRRKSIESN